MELLAMYYFFVFLYAIVIGSFLNVVIYRVPLGISIAKGRSYCPKCEHSLGALDLFPVLSFLFLGRRCRYCRAKISWRYPAIELACGVLGLFCAYYFGFTLEAIGAFCMGCILLAITMIDYDTMTIPDGLNIALGVVAIGLMIWGPELRLIERVLGVFSVAAPMYLALYCIEDCFGGGDIKLMAVSGFLLGWKLNYLAAFIGVVLGGVAGLFLLRKKNRSEEVHMAFGPYLCVGIFVSYCFGMRILEWYLGML